jgi:hypothetical protein
VYRSAYGGNYDTGASAQAQRRNLFEEDVEIDVGGGASTQYQPPATTTSAYNPDTTSYAAPVKQEQFEYKPTYDSHADTQQVSGASSHQSQIISDLNKMKLQDGASSGLEDVFEQEDPRAA